MSDFFLDCLGARANELAPIVRKAHSGNTFLEGEVCVQRGNFAARLLCHLLGMPPEKSRCRLVVLGEHTFEKMTWNRCFDDFSMNSYFYKDGCNLVERLGAIHMSLELDVIDNKLIYTLAKTRIFGISIPKFLSPKVVAVEEQVAEKYRFRVLVALPLIGKLVSYFGDMNVEALTGAGWKLEQQVNSGEKHG